MLLVIKLKLSDFKLSGGDKYLSSPLKNIIMDLQIGDILTGGGYS